MLVSAMTYNLGIWLIKNNTHLKKNTIIKKYVTYAYKCRLYQSGQHNISVPSYILVIIAQLENETSSVPRIPFFWTFRGRRTLSPKKNCTEYIYITRVEFVLLSTTTFPISMRMPSLLKPKSSSK